MKKYIFLNLNYNNLKIGKDITFREEDLLLDYILNKGDAAKTALQQEVCKQRTYQIINKCIRRLARKGITMPS